MSQSSFIKDAAKRKQLRSNPLVTFFNSFTSDKEDEQFNKMVKDIVAEDPKSKKPKKRFHSPPEEKAKPLEEEVKPRALRRRSSFSGLGLAMREAEPETSKSSSFLDFSVHSEPDADARQPHLNNFISSGPLPLDENDVDLNALMQEMKWKTKMADSQLEKAALEEEVLDSFLDRSSLPHADNPGKDFHSKGPPAGKFLHLKDAVQHLKDVDEDLESKDFSFDVHDFMGRGNRPEFQTRESLVDRNIGRSRLSRDEDWENHQTDQRWFARGPSSSIQSSSSEFSTRNLDLAPQLSERNLGNSMDLIL